MNLQVEQPSSILYLKDYISKDTIHCSSYSYPKYHHIPLHSHDFFEIFIVLEGRFVHWFNGSMQLLEKGDMQLVKPFDIHSFEGASEKMSVLYNLAFSEEIYNKLRHIIEMETYDYTSVVRLPSYQYKTLRSHIDLMRSDKISNYQCLLSVLQAYNFGLLSNAVRHCDKSNNVHTWLKKSMNQMESLENLRIGLSRFVELTGKSQEHLSRTMKSCFGITATQWINEHRLEASKNLLITTNMPIIDILYEVGFESESYFYRLYKKHFGQTPLNDRIEGKSQLL